jgi:hypothetical protein
MGRLRWELKVVIERPLSASRQNAPSQDPSDDTRQRVEGGGRVGFEGPLLFEAARALPGVRPNQVRAHVSGTLGPVSRPIANWTRVCCSPEGVSFTRADERGCAVHERGCVEHTLPRALRQVVQRVMVDGWWCLSAATLKEDQLDLGKIGYGTPSHPFPGTNRTHLPPPPGTNRTHLPPPPGTNRTRSLLPPPDRYKPDAHLFPAPPPHRVQIGRT